MDSLVSVLTAFDVVAYLLSGSTLLAGVYWAIAGVPEKAPGGAAVLGLAALGYVTGVLIAGVASLRGRESARLRRLLGRPDLYAANAPAAPDSGASLPATYRHIWTRWYTNAEDPVYLTTKVRQRVDRALGTLSTLETDGARAEVARVLLRQRRADAWFDRMMLSMWLMSYLGTTAVLLTACFLLTAATESDPGRLLPAAAGAALAALLLSRRQSDYERYAIRAVVYELVVLDDPPAWAGATAP
jgi:hypothetical protein